MLGHEVLGKVVEVEENARVSVGERVVAEINNACENCEVCEKVFKENDIQ